jgi:hypothetical protein
MKIKRFNNLWAMGLIISAALLGAIYLLKIIVPEFVIEVAHIDSIVAIGHYIDEHKWAWYLASAIVSFVSYYLICCACCKKKSLNGVEIIIVVSTILILFIIREFLPSQYTSANISSMILLPFIMKADFKATTVVFVATNFVQTITGEIRNIAALITDFNFATALIVTIDFYILEFLLYSYFNFKERSIENGIS